MRLFVGLFFVGTRIVNGVIVLLAYGCLFEVKGDGDDGKRKRLAEVGPRVPSEPWSVRGVQRLIWCGSA